MHQKCPFEIKILKIYWGGGLTPSPRPIPSAPRRPQPPSQKTLKKALICALMVMSFYQT